MTRRRRTELVAKADIEVLRGMVHAVRNSGSVRVIQEPQSAMVMLKFRESGCGSLFYLGEMLVTEAKVSIGEALGLGIAQHDDDRVAKERALSAAIIDAAYAAGFPETDSWEALLEEQADRIAVESAEDWKRILRSKVSFDTMDTNNGE